MSNYQSHDNNNRGGRRNVPYERNNNSNNNNNNGQRSNPGGYRGHRERSNSDSNIQTTSDRYNSHGNNRYRQASPGGNDNRGSHRSRSPSDRYPGSRRRVVPTQDYRGNNDSGGHSNFGTRIPNPFAPREDRNTHDRRHTDRETRGGGGESSHYSGRPAPYKPDTNKAKRLDCLEFFKFSSLEELRDFCRDEEEVRLKSMKGELIYKTLLFQLIGDRFVREHDRHNVILQQTRYTSLFVLSIFLNQGTNFRALVPEVGGKQPDYYGLLAYALIYEAAHAPDHHFVNLAPWFSCVKGTKEWIDGHVNFDRTYPSVDGREVVWRTGATGDVKWKESVLHEYEYAAPTSNTVPPSLSHHFDDRHEPRSRGDRGDRDRPERGGGSGRTVDQTYNHRSHTGHTTVTREEPPATSGRYSGREVKESPHHNAAAARNGNETGDREQRSNNNNNNNHKTKLRSEQPSTRNNNNTTTERPTTTTSTTSQVTAVKPVTEPKVLPLIPYRNFIDITPKLASVLTKEAKIYTEKYGNTLNFTPNAQAGHVWNDLRLRSTTVFGQATAKSWTGAQCTHCQAFLARCKVNNKFWNLFILGQTECPGRPASEWLATYRQRMNQKFTEQEEFLQDKFTWSEVCEWGFATPAEDEQVEGK